MAADEHPIDALSRRFEMEDATASPVARLLLEAFAQVPLLPPPFDRVVALLKDHAAADWRERIALFVRVFADELKKQDMRIGELRQHVGAAEEEHRARAIRDLVLDAARKASVTRARVRVQRIAFILANGVGEAIRPDEDEIEEMMRIAMELTDSEVDNLRELVRVQGRMLERVDHIERQHGHRAWESCHWGTRIENSVESAFSKMASYGLVSRIPPPNNLNITADFQNRYVLLKKGLRFVTLIREQASLDQ